VVAQASERPAEVVAKALEEQFRSARVVEDMRSMRSERQELPAIPALR
jgi:hypothetical protein